MQPQQPNLDHRDAETDRRPPVIEDDDNAPDNGTSIASQGDLNKIERMSVALSALFPSSPSTATSPNANSNNSDNESPIGSPVKSSWEEGDWRELIFFKETRELFLQELDEQRGRRSLLTREGFASMCNAMKVESSYRLYRCFLSFRQVLLDYCETFDDAKAAMRVVNMANTFHTM